MISKGNVKGNFISYRTMIVKKVNIEENEKMKSQLDVLFSDPAKYFLTNSDENVIVIGKKNKSLDFGNSRKNSLSKIASRGSKLYRSTRPLINSQFLEKSICSPGSNVEKRDFISDIGIKELFEKFKKIKHSNSRKQSEIMNELEPIGNHDKIKKSLQSQEKVLLNKDQSNEISLKIAKYLANKTHKSEDTLLMNRTEGPRINNELINNLELNTSLNHQYNIDHWVFNLRQPINFLGKLYNYINIGTNLNPKWKLVCENSQNLTEIARKPLYNGQNDTQKFIKNSYFKTKYGDKKIEDFKSCSKRLENISIQGRDLLETEFENAKLLKGKKVIYNNELSNDMRKDEVFAKSVNFTRLIKRGVIK